VSAAADTGVRLWPWVMFVLIIGCSSPLIVEVSERAARTWRIRRDRRNRERVAAYLARLRSISAAAAKVARERRSEPTEKPACRVTGAEEVPQPLGASSPAPPADSLPLHAPGRVDGGPGRAEPPAGPTC
jgi:hypothetical protein